jgi:hypothetical protein
MSRIQIIEASYNLTTRTKRSAASTASVHPQSPCFVLSAPINCPPSPPSDDGENEKMSIEQSKEYYNARTWNMYNRIMKCRKGGQKKKNSQILSHQRIGSFGKTRRKIDSQATNNPALDEIFYLEL